MDYSPPVSVHGISQARILEWVAISFSRGYSWPKDETQVSFIDRWILYCLEPAEKPNKLWSGGQILLYFPWVEKACLPRKTRIKKLCRRTGRQEIQWWFFLRFSNFPVASFCLSLRSDWVFAFGVNPYILIIKSSFVLMLKIVTCNPESLKYARGINGKWETFSINIVWLQYKSFFVLMLYLQETWVHLKSNILIWNNVSLFI